MHFTKKTVLGVLIAGALNSAPLLAAGDANFVAKVSRAKKSLYASADAAFVKTMSEKGAEIMQAGITPSQVRDVSKWAGLGFSLGVCAATDTQLADWFAAFDKLSISQSFSGSEVVKTFYEVGSNALSEGRADDTLAGLTSAEKAGFCRVEMAAVNEIIKEFR